MARKVPWTLVLGVVALTGCGGSIQEAVMDTVQATAKESLEQAVDETINGIFDGLTDELPDFGELSDDDEPGDE